MQVEEKSTLAILVEFFDETGTAVTPTSASFTLTNEAGSIVNSRNQSAISPADGSAVVVLTGNDLALTAGENGKRKLLVLATYNSTNGSGLSLRKEYDFSVINLVGVT